MIYRTLFACVSILAFFATSLRGQSSLDRPVLVVVVSVDQWRFDYFERFRANLSEDGIAKRTQAGGAWFDNCYHQHAFTYTGPGHSVFLTGAYPSQTGIIGNEWYDRTAHKEVNCVLDDGVQIIGTTNYEDPVSPRKLLVDTVGDQLKMATGFRSKVFGIGIKDRAAILMGGHLADAAYWMGEDGKWITSDHYRPSLPGYLRVLNEQRANFRFAGKTWSRLHPPTTYVHGAHENSKHELPVDDMTADFPHVLPDADHEFYIKQLNCTPFGNTATFDAVREVVIHERLGQDEYPDILAINLSSTDYVGHAFGPHSLEVEDMTYRTDRLLGQFTEFLNQQLGDRTWVMFVTADHGVAPVPELAAEWQLSAKRDPLGVKNDDGMIEQMRQKLDAVLRAEFKVVRDDLLLVAALGKNQVYLNRLHPALQGDQAVLARRVARDYLVNHESVAYAVTRDELQQEWSGDKMVQVLQRSFHAQRSGDVLYFLKPYQFTDDAAATHGSPWRYDRHVPLMILSNKQRLRSKDTKSDEVSPAMIAPTIARMLRIEMPSGCVERRLDLTP